MEHDGLCTFFFGQCLPLPLPSSPIVSINIPPDPESYHQTFHSFAAIHRLSNPFIYSSYAPVVPPCSADADNHMHVALRDETDDWEEDEE
jgi:hypothetical protein